MDPLAQLRDIHLPDPVSSWPPAIGWWLLAIALLASLIALAYLLWRYVKKNHYRRMAIKALAQIQQEYNDKKNASIYLNNINILLKKVSVIYYQKERIAKLTGETWLAFLDETADTNHFSSGPGKILATAPYQAPAEIEVGSKDADGLYQCASYWIRKHR